MFIWIACCLCFSYVCTCFCFDLSQINITYWLVFIYLDGLRFSIVLLLYVRCLLLYVPLFDLLFR